MASCTGDCLGAYCKHISKPWSGSRHHWWEWEELHDQISTLERSFWREDSQGEKEARGKGSFIGRPLQSPGGRWPSREGSSLGVPDQLGREPGCQQRPTNPHSQVAWGPWPQGEWEMGALGPGLTSGGCCQAL